MANPPVVVTGRVAKEVKSGVSQKPGKPDLDYASFTLVEDTTDGAKWYDAVAFGTLAKLVTAKLTKGMEVKVVGSLTIKEYQKKDGGGTGTSNNLALKKLILEGGVELDKFTKVPAESDKQVEADSGKAPF
jgi:single-stranded DNA-binding protein